MSDLHDDLKATSESLREDAVTVATLEARKSELPPSDPRLAVISERVEQVVKRMATTAAAESELVAEIGETDRRPN